MDWIVVEPVREILVKINLWKQTEDKLGEAHSCSQKALRQLRQAVCWVCWSVETTWEANPRIEGNPQEKG